MSFRDRIHQQTKQKSHKSRAMLVPAMHGVSENQVDEKQKELQKDHMSCKCERRNQIMAVVMIMREALFQTK